MALTIINSKRKVRRFLTYDLEWVPGSLDVRLVGVYDEIRGYRYYETVRGFLANELTHKNRGSWFYAHAGGLADVQFVLEEILAHGGYSVRASFSGSSAIIVHIRRGKNSWHFIDSYWLLRDSLERIGKWVGLDKGAKEKRRTEAEAREFYATAPLSELIPYNEQDCVILYRAISEFENHLLEIGGQLQMTIASSAMHLFRRKFLSRNIETSSCLNALAREAYFASRVEVFERECERAEYYDINSSFPHAMTKACPGEFLGTLRTIPDYGLYMADVTLETPEVNIPPIPTRVKGRLFFPIGKWRSWLTSVDIELLQDEGGRILKVHEAKQFAPFDDLREYALTIFNRRKHTEGFERMAYKYLLNSLYGKFAEGNEKNSLLIDPETINRHTSKMLFPGVWIQETEVPIPHAHVVISAHITAIARRTLFDYLTHAGLVHYCDTDGFSTKREFPTGEELGELKLEKFIRRGTFIAPKVYRLEGTDGKGKELGDEGCKAKGFSRMTIERWEKLKDDEEIEYLRMRRIKELYKKGDMKPREDLILKRLRRVLIPKRYMYPDGRSRPWHIGELT